MSKMVWGCITSAALATMWLSNSAVVIGQQQPPVVTHPSTSSAQASPRKPAPPYDSAAGSMTKVKIPAGTITGYVYWAMSGVQSKAAASCLGLTAQVGTLGKAGMQVVSTTNTFTALGPMTDYSATGAPKYMLCSYSFHNMPEQVYLQVQVSAPPGEFAPAVVNASAFQIPGGNCNNGPQSTLSYILSGGQMLCGNNAYNINLKLTALPDRRLVPTPGPKPLLPRGPAIR